MATRLTKRDIDKFSYRGGTDIRFDAKETGLGVRVYPSGRKAFILQFRFKGQKKRVTLAPYGTGQGSLTLEQARARARRMLVAVADGEDPLKTKRKTRLQGTLKQLSEAYFSEREDAGKKTVKKMRERFARNTPKGWLSRVAADIETEEMNGLKTKIGKRGHYEANRYIQILRAMFEKGLTGSLNDLDSGLWFFQKGAQNPAANVELYAEKKRKRHVREFELPELAKAIDAHGNVYVRAALWLYLLTGARKTELLALRREQQDAEPYLEMAGRQIVLPDPKSEGDSDQTIPLSPIALAIIQGIPETEGNPYLLPGRRKGKHLVNIDEPWREIRDAAGLHGLRLHDLRRTVGSWMSASGVDLNTIKHGLRHASISTTLTYAHLGADPARQALDDHGKRLMTVAGKLRVQGDGE